VTAPPGTPRFRKPPVGPTRESLEDRDRWDALTASSLASTRAAAEKWRVGLAAFITVVTGGLLIKGPEAANALTTPWRVAVTALAAGGLIATVAGLWLALEAAAGMPARLDLSTLVARYGGVRQFEIACAATASSALRRARVLIAGALLLLGAAVFVWWWAPPDEPRPSATVAVQTRGSMVCGALDGADGQVLRVRVAGHSDVQRIALSSVRKVQVVSSC